MKEPIHRLVLAWDPDAEVRTWRSIAFVLAGGVLECGKALRRIADAMERTEAHTAHRSRAERVSDHERMET